MRAYTSTRINIVVPIDLLDSVDEAALSKAMNRSTFIRLSLLEKLERERPKQDTQGKKIYRNLEEFLKSPDFWPDENGKRPQIPDELLE